MNKIITAFDKRILTGFGTALVLFAAIGFLSYFRINQLLEETKWVDHTYNVLLNLKDVFSDIKDIETGGRGFLISGEERYLEPYHWGMTDIVRSSREVRHLTMDNPVQKKRLDRLEPLIAQKIAFTDQMITLRRAKGIEAAQDIFLTGKGKSLMDQIRKVVHDLENEENLLLKRRYNKEIVASQLTVIAMAVGGILAFVVILVAIIFIFREIRIRRVAEEQLEHQKKELEQVNLELDSFVYTASHDLRAPLRGISSFASFLNEDYGDKFDSQAKGYINEIRKGTERMSNVIEDLLTLSRITRIKNPYEDVNINQLIDTVVKRLEFDIQKYKANLNVKTDIPLIHCDRIKMTEVFVNLINNAIKYSSKNDKEFPRVEIGYTDQGEFHEFYVKDNGIGIEPQYHQQIFGLFKRLHANNEYDGTGAGLSIVKRVVDSHGGRVWVESQLAQGATFYFTIAKNLE